MQLWIKWFRYRCQVRGLWDSVQMAVQNCPWEHWPGHLKADSLSCAEKWPPLTVDALHLHAEAGLAEGGVYFLLCQSLLLLHLIFWTKALGRAQTLAVICSVPLPSSEALLYVCMCIPRGHSSKRDPHWQGDVRHHRCCCPTSTQWLFFLFHISLRIGFQCKTSPTF